MVVYSERVEMVTASRRLFLLAVAVGLAFYFTRDIEDWQAWWEVGQKILTHLHVAVGAVTAIGLAFSNQMVIELTNNDLVLHAALSRKRIPLKEIRGAKTLPEISPDHPTFSFLSFIGWHTSFVSQVVKTGVHLSFFDGTTIEFSSNNADHMASMIDQLARQAVAREPLESAAKTPSVLATTVRRMFR